MIPCKFQLDESGERCLVYSENKTSIFAIIETPEFIQTIRDELKLTPMSKAYAKAELSEDGQLTLGEQLFYQFW